jgi:hypothetical protein
MPTQTATRTLAPSATPTQTSTPFIPPTQTATPVYTPTPQFTPQVRQYKLYIPSGYKNYPLQCLTWASRFEDHFLSSTLGGWFVDLGGGYKDVSGSELHLWTLQSIDKFPLVWRNDLFSFLSQTGPQKDYDEFEFEVRFRHSDFTAYGTTIALNSITFNGQRVPASPQVPTGLENILQIHHVYDAAANRGFFKVSMLRDRVLWQGVPGDTRAHTVRVTLDQGGWYTLYVDGVRVRSVQSPDRPVSIYIGNPFIQFYWGGWTHIHVDYVRIRTCIGWGPWHTVWGANE